MSKDWDYSQLSHEASQHGGPDKFLKDHADANYQLGVEAEKDTEGWKAALVTAAAIGAWEFGKGVWRWTKGRHTRKKEQAVLKAKAAEEELLRGMRSAAQSEAKNDESMENPPDQ